AFAQYTSSFASFPQQTHVSEILSCSSGIQRDVADVSSLIFSSQASSPHHIALMNPPLFSRTSLNSLNDFTAVVISSRCFKARSEEHMSELQSRFDLVCRLLL